MHQLCKGEEHNRFEIVTKLDSKKYKEVGVCRECGTKRYYPHDKPSFSTSLSLTSKPKDYLAYQARRERHMFLNRGLVGGA
jgi:protein-arginine kinase activator protein McsA